MFCHSSPKEPAHRLYTAFNQNFKVAQLYTHSIACKFQDSLKKCTKEKIVKLFGLYFLKEHFLCIDIFYRIMFHAGTDLQTCEQST